MNKASECPGCLTTFITSLFLIAVPAMKAASANFQVEESTIEQTHMAIQAGQTSCTQIVEAYLARARAYNGTCTALVTEDGSNISPGTGTVRSGLPLTFPTQTVAARTLLPDLDDYEGPPIDFGRLEATASNPAAQQQYGFVTGIAGLSQVNALNTLNIRGERSATCSAECDAAPGNGALPAYCPRACEQFRRQPDALETAAALDARFGRNPDLEKMPMYCIAMSFKDVFDTVDMRSTGGADANYAADFPTEDATIVKQLRDKGAIILAKANLSEYNGGSGNPGGDAKATGKTFGAGARSSWGGTACNAYDSARETGGSSSGSAVSVGANMVTCSICEETGGSCRQPAWRNGVVGLVTTKGLMPYGGAIGADPYLDRAGVHCRTVADTARVLDALNDERTRYFDPRDIYSALPRALLPTQPYSASTVERDTVLPARPLAGIRIGIVREYMVKHSANDGAVSDRIDAEIKRVLRDQLGAELVESRDPLYPDDPDIADMTYDFQAALAEILPFHMPEYFTRVDDDGNPLYAVEGFDVHNRDYLVALAQGQAPLSDKLNLRSINEGPDKSLSFSFHMQQYLARRGDSRITDWQSLNANSKFYAADKTAAMINWANAMDITADGMTKAIKMREVMRLVVEKVMAQNDLDVLVNPTSTVPPALIGHASQPVANNRPVGRFPTSANLGIPEITVPAGYNDIIYEPGFALNEKRDGYVGKANDTEASRMAVPMPFGLSFWAGIGTEPTLFKIASIYEAATRHRQPPAALPPLPASMTSPALSATE
ncbi:MAG: amidase [Gammaproteobacteria bacterium]|nr:amidase [Gammaproteobacteria bacterium]